MRKEIDKYFSKYLTSTKKIKNSINQEQTSAMELDKEIIESIVNENKKIFAASIYSYDSFFKSMPVKNRYTVITHKHSPKCIIKTLKVETVKFKDITKENVNMDLDFNNIKDWKKHYISTFEEECREALRVFNIDVPIVIETFELVYA